MTDEMIAEWEAQIMAVDKAMRDRIFILTVAAERGSRHGFQYERYKKEKVATIYRKTCNRHISCVYRRFGR